MRELKSRNMIVAGCALGAAVGAIFWIALRDRDPEKLGQSPEIPPIPERWEPIFAKSPDRDRCLALARRIDETFDLRWIAPWVGQISPHSAGSRDEEVTFFIFNELVERHRLAEIDPGRLARTLAGLLGDQELHPVLRDYAAQHLALIAEAHPEHRGRVVGDLCAFLRDTENHDTEIAGTVVNALGGIRARAGAFEPSEGAEIAAAVGGVLDSPRASLPLRISLFQSATPETANLFLPTLRKTLTDPATPDALALAAVGALSRIGDPQRDLELLVEVEARGTHASLAAASAIRRLQLHEEDNRGKKEH